jgi:predicted ester cyclase
VTEQMKALTLSTLERGFNQGDVSVFDEVTGHGGTDHQEPVGTDFASHLKDAVRMLRTAFPDLNFTVHHTVAEGDIVAFHSTMTGTHLGPLTLGPGRTLPPTGKAVAVRHMHFLRWEDGLNTDLWHVWDVAGMLRQHGAAQPANA